MKVLAATQTELKETDKSDAMTYLDLAKICLNRAPQGGFSADEMRSRFRVLDAIENAQAQQAEHLQLEDADATKLQGCVSAMPWPRMDRQLLEFTDAVANMAAAQAEQPAESR